MHSFSKRLTRRIVLALTLALAVIIVGVFYQASSIMEVMTRAYYQNVADIANESVEKRLHDIEVGIKNSIDEVEWQLPCADSIFVALQDKLQRNPSPVLGFGAAFEPYYYAEKGRWFEPYAMWTNGKIEVKQIGSAAHDYLSMEWYCEGLKSDGGHWTDPYLDESGAGMLICTHSLPIHDARGRKVGVFGSDLSLDNLQAYLKQKDVKANTEGPVGTLRKDEGDPERWVRTIIVGREGNYISHPDKERILHDNFFEDVRQQPDTIVDRMISNMKAGRKGSAKTKVDGVDATVFYTPLEHTGWSLAVILPDERLNAVVIRFCINLAFILFLGLLAVYVISRITIRHATRPLHFLAKSADEVAKGNFNAPLPDIRHDDEIRQLRDSFGNMQQSLSRYIEELQATTAQKSAIESELAIARNIQMSMLPTAQLSSLTSQLDLYAKLTPAKAVGGDLYDYFVNGECLYFCIGDVSGKGVPAALLMAVMKAMFRSEARRAERAAGIVNVMNRNLCEEYTGGEFVTMFVGILNLASGLLDYCNAGHEPPLLSGSLFTVHSSLSDKPNLPVGALADWNYEGQQVMLKAGDLLFLYTDGLSEAKNTADEQLGRKHVRQIFGEHAADTARQLVEVMEAEERRHVGDAEQSDDITLLALRWQPASQASDSGSPAGTPTAHLSLLASMDDIARLEPFIASVAQQLGLEGREAKRLRLAVEEAVANIINHGQATAITLQAVVEDHQLVLTIDDDGQPFDPTADSPTDFSVPADERPPGGLGIMFLHQMTDGLSYQRIGTHNVLRIIKLKKQ